MPLTSKWDTYLSLKYLSFISWNHYYIKLLGFEFSSFFWLNGEEYHNQVGGISLCSPLLNEIQFNPLQPGVAFLYPPENIWRFSDVFRGYRKATPGCNGLTSLNILLWKVAFSTIALSLDFCNYKVLKMHSCLTLAMV